MIEVWLGARLRVLLKKFKRHESSLSKLVATIIGGAKISFDDAVSNHDIGERNIAIAREVMAEFCVPVTARSVGAGFYLIPLLGGLTLMNLRFLIVPGRTSIKIDCIES